MCIHTHIKSHCYLCKSITGCRTKKCEIPFCNNIKVISNEFNRYLTKLVCEKCSGNIPITTCTLLPVNNLLALEDIINDKQINGELIVSPRHPALQRFHVKN